MSALTYTVIVHDTWLFLQTRGNYCAAVSKFKTNREAMLAADLLFNRDLVWEKKEGCEEWKAKIKTA